MFLSNAMQAATPGPESDFWFQPVGQKTLSGAMVTSETAPRLSTVYKCVRAYSDAIGTMPRRLMRQTGPRKRERVLNHPVAQLLSVKPNRWQTPAQFVGMLEAHAQLRGRGYAEIFLDSKFRPDELVPIHPDRVTTEVMLDGTPRWQVAPPKGQTGERRVLLPGEMFHITSMVMDGYEGLSPIEVQRESIGNAIAARDYGSRYWNNDARPPFWIEVPGKFKDTEDKTNFRENWQASYGGANRARPAVLDRGMKIHEIGLSNVDSQWLEAVDRSEKDIAGIWRVPLHKIGILTDAKYANIEQQAIEWVTDSLLPRMVIWEETVLRDLLGYDPELYLKFVPDQLLRGDTKSRYESYGKGIQDGWLTRNEARDLEDRDPLPGLDEPLQPLNMTRAGGQQVLPSRDRGNDRTQAILQAAAGRVARREGALIAALAAGKEDAGEAFRKHVRFVADAMALPVEVAAGYVDKVQAAFEAHRAAGTLGSITAEQYIDTQTAALVRLGE